MSMKESTRIKTLSDLLTASPKVKWVNLVTLFRIVAFPVLLVLIFNHQFEIFTWLLIISFLTDAIDGYLARNLKATSILGTKLDSIGDDLTVLAAAIGLWVAKSDFIKTEFVIFAIPLSLYILQIVSAFVRYHRMSNFHTYLAKVAAILQGFFLCSMFLLDSPVYWLFYATALMTTLDLIEEIILVAVLPEWKTNVKGLYWVLQGMKRGKK